MWPEVEKSIKKQISRLRFAAAPWGQARNDSNKRVYCVQLVSSKNNEKASLRLIFDFFIVVLHFDF